MATCRAAQADPEARLHRRPVPWTHSPAPHGASNLALQGGGAHGAFTWGVLDRLLQEPRPRDRRCLRGQCRGHERRGDGPRPRRRWARGASKKAFAATPFDRATGLAGLGLSPGALWLEGLSRLASPYDLNPSGRNPLAEVLAERVDFDALRRGASVRLFVGATNARSGKLRIFGPDEISLSTKVVRLAETGEKPR